MLQVTDQRQMLPIQVESRRAAAGTRGNWTNEAVIDCRGEGCGEPTEVRRVSAWCKKRHSQLTYAAIDGHGAAQE